jgi:wobble nucleotide-excising tRNase
MIRKIKSIKSYGIFDNFDWDARVRDKGNNVGQFNKLNIIYGRNYSGKTTLSRIIRSFENGIAHEKYPLAQFELTHDTDGRLSERDLSNHQSIIRVYNKDFVTENLKWLTDEGGSIKPFAIIGQQNVEIEKQILEQEGLLGSVEEGTGLYGDKKIIADAAKNKKDERNRAVNGLDEKLRKKALYIMEMLTTSFRAKLTTGLADFGLQQML